MKRRFPILLKVIILGIGVSILTAGAAITVSYFNQKNQAEKNIVDNIDNTLDGVDDIFTDAEGQYTISYVKYLTDVKKYVKNIYDNDTEKPTPDQFDSFEAFANDYKARYRWLYNVDPRFGILQPGESEFKIEYFSILNLLNNFQMSSAGKSVFLAYRDTDNRMIFLADSRMDNAERKPNDYYHVPGFYYQIDQNDYFDDRYHQAHRGYILSGYLTRFTDIYTLPDEYGNRELIASLFIQYSFDSAAAETRDVLLKELLILGLSSLVLIAIYTVFSYLLFVKNVNKLSNASERIRQNVIDNNLNNVSEINIKSNDEMKVLAESMTEMERAIINYADIIKQEAREKERTNAELAVASKIQLDSLPESVFEDQNTSLRTYIKTAKEVGGDFYDYFYLDENRMVVLISDVSGKGIPASLFMMKGKELIKSALQSYKSLVEAINSVNNMLVKNNKELLFITSFIGVIDFSKNEIRYVNAGQEKPYIVSNNEVIKLEGESNIVLGVEEGYSFKEESHKFNKGDYLFMFTDGLNESINDSNEEFGYQRVEDALANTSDLPLDEVINKVNSNLDEFAGCKEQFDDITIIVAKNRDNELKLHYEKKDYEVITDIVNRFNESYDYLSEGTKASVGIIIDEMVNNLISYEKREDLVIDVEFNLLKEGLRIRIISNGEDYNPFANHKEKYLEKFHSEIKEGGFGLSIVKDLTKSYKYEYKDGHSIIEVVVK